ncbi:ATP11 protein [Gracilaria domingensis]|nr:ATP11 protein [Gracilaria domingensis]
MSRLRPLCSSLVNALLRTPRGTWRIVPTRRPEVAITTGAFAVTDWSQKRLFSTQNETPVRRDGFSYPGPRKLSEIVKIQLLDKQGSMRVREIWNEYHADHKSAVGDVLSAEEYELFKHRTSRCKHFVLPVSRGTGFFTLLVQFQGNHCLLTFLEDYKKNPTGAQPYMTITVFDDMVETKQVALLRGEVVNVLTTEEAKK